MKQRGLTHTTWIVPIAGTVVGVMLACNFPGVIPSPAPTPTAEGESATPAADTVPLPAPPASGATRTWADGGLLVYIPAGEFAMGDDGDGTPRHTVYLDGFWIYRTEVTLAMYWRCVSMGNCTAPAGAAVAPDLSSAAVANRPVVDVTWQQAEAYCSSVDGHLPTEAQWEKSARGPAETKYPWGEDEPTCDLLNFNNCTGRTTHVMSYAEGASGYDMLDMAGNAVEWVADWYDEAYYTASPREDPPGPPTGEVRVVRGSAFDSTPDLVPSALRMSIEPQETRPNLGFRCVVGHAERYAPACEILAYIAESELAQNPTPGPGGSAACVVPQPEVAVVHYCSAHIPAANISWTPVDAETGYAAAEGVSCTEFPPDQLVCSGPEGSTVEFRACKSCPPPHVDLGVPASCDVSYSLDETTGLCRYAGVEFRPADLCTPGSVLSAHGTTECCQLEGGSTPSDYPVCPVGGLYDSLANICWFTLPSTGDEKCATESVYLSGCVQRENEPGGPADLVPPQQEEEPGSGCPPGSPNCP
jgi:sulfatase modifying factor 1